MIDYDAMLEANREYLYADKEDVKAFLDLKFGVFIHWNPSCLVEGEISWSRFGPRGTEAVAEGGIPVEEYDNLYKKFNPVNFDAEEWVQMVKDAGAKYLIFTTKHHDGFCMFDAPNTDYKITNTPFGRDICKELADACHKMEMKLFWYFSKPDWKHPDYLTENQNKCCDYIHEHLRFLLTNYGKIDGLWFDCLGTSWKDWRTPEMVKMIRELQPHILINQRWGWGMDMLEYQGDYDLAEQEIGEFNIDRAWESSITMAHNWSWSGDTPLKSVGICLHVLLQSVGAGGNFALNTGPRPDGTINPPEVEQYLEIGKWLSANGESVYSTNAGPYKPGPWGVATNAGKKIYLHILSRYSDDAEKVLKLPILSYEIESCSDLQGNSVDYRVDENYLYINLLELKDFATIVVLNLTEEIPEKYEVIDTDKEYEIYNPIKAAASTSKDEEHSAVAFMQSGNAEFQAGIHHKKHWAPEYSDRNPWLFLEFEKEIEFDTIQIAENIWSISVDGFEIEYKDGAGNWVTCYTGKEIGLDFAVKTSLIKTSAVRLKVNSLLPNAQTGITKFDVELQRN